MRFLWLAHLALFHFRVIATTEEPPCSSADAAKENVLTCLAPPAESEEMADVQEVSLLQQSAQVLGGLNAFSTAGSDAVSVSDAVASKEVSQLHTLTRLGGLRSFGISGSDAEVGEEVSLLQEKQLLHMPQGQPSFGRTGSDALADLNSSAMEGDQVMMEGGQGAATKEVEDKNWYLRWEKENPQMKNWPPLKRLPSDPHVVISLSTVPAGVAGLGPTLRSLKKQNFAADAIELNLPMRSARGLGNYSLLPPSLNSLGINVYRTDDWLALTNIIPTVQRAKVRGGNTLVIVVDDDKAYPPSLVEDHVRAHRLHPRSASTCRGYKMPPGGDISSAVFWPAWDELGHSIYGQQKSEAEQVAVVTGSDSWSVPAMLFTDGLWEDLEEIGDTTVPIRGDASLMNDIWVSGQLSRQHVPKFVVPCRQECQDPPKTAERKAQNLALERTESTSHVMRHFLKDWVPKEVMTEAEVDLPRFNPEDTHFRDPLPKVSLSSWVFNSLGRSFRSVVLGA